MRYSVFRVALPLQGGRKSGLSIDLQLTVNTVCMVANGGRAIAQFCRGLLVGRTIRKQGGNLPL